MDRRRTKQSSTGGGRKRRQVVAADRLSPLPDATLLHILSFIPTKLSITTSALARRFRFLWARVPTLSFHTPSIPFFDSPYDSHADPDEIHRVMLLHEAPNLDTFSLIGTNCTEFQLDTWITTAIRRNVRSIHLELRCFKLPRSTLTCKTLVNLILESPTCILSDGGGVKNVCLPNLKKLHLLSVEYEDDEALVRFLSGCPVLEDFVISRSVGFKGCCLKISSPTIKKLQAGFDGNDYHLEPDGKYEYEMKIDAPELVYLRVDDCCFKHVTFSNRAMTSLVEVKLQLIGNYYDTYSKEDKNYTRYVVKFLDSICHVERLNIMTHFTMDWSALQTLDKEVVGSIVMFPNLTTLEITGMDVGWDFLLKFLEIADNLEVLIVDVRDVENWVDPEQVPACMISSLTSIRIDRLLAGENELSMVRYLLRNSLELEMMELSLVRDDEPDWDEVLFDAIQKISLFERGSPECELAFTPTQGRG